MIAPPLFLYGWPWITQGLITFLENTCQSRTDAVEPFLKIKIERWLSDYKLQCSEEIG